MTHGEIKLTLFIVVALLVGALHQRWNRSQPSIAPTPTPAASKKWAQPPYVFKNREAMEKAAENVKAEDEAEKYRGR